MTFKEKQCSEQIYVFERATNLLSCKASHALGIVSFVGVVAEEEYPQLICGLRTMDEVYDIKPVDDARPYSVRMPRRVPLPLMPQLKHEFGRLQKQGVIESVDEPTEWCAPIVVVPKASGKIRLCVDLTKLNRAERREKYMMPSVDHVLGQLGEAKVFSKLDANSGFHQVLLTEQSKKLTTFLTPFGRYCYNRLPFGISSAPEHFQKQVTRTIAGLSGVVCLLDDILVYGKDQAVHDSPG